MKKILAILVIFVVFTSCNKLEDLNKNTKDPSSTTGESLFTGAQKRIFDQMVTSNVNFNIWRLIDQYWTETTYLDETNYNLVNRSIPDDHWDRLYQYGLKNLDEAKKIITSTAYADASPAIKQNKLAIVDVMSVYVWSILVETFGDVPYQGAIDNTLSSQALDINNVLPKYDNGLKVYKDLVARLNADMTAMDANWGSFGSADNMYGGNVDNWVKFANSLKLKIGINLADVDPVFAKATVEAAATAGVFTANIDNAVLQYMSSQPNTNPIWEDQIASGRHDFVPARTIVDSMNTRNDPRLLRYFSHPVAFKYRKSNGANQDSVVSSGLARMFIFKDYLGVFDSVVYKQPPYTILAADSADLKFIIGAKYGKSANFSSWAHPHDSIYMATYPGVIFDYSEVEFLLAEAVERGFSVGGTAESHYNKAITASIEEWYRESIPSVQADAAAYIAQPKVAYTTAPGTWKQKIGVQQWIAYYNRGFEGWTAQRRLDFPVLIPGPNALSDYPVRFTFPVEEQTLNSANYQAASAAIGGDLVTTKLFWDMY